MRSYGLWDTRITVSCDEAAVLAWLDEFLEPAFASRPEGDAETAVHLRPGRAAYEAAAAAAATGPRRDVACFARDGDVTRRTRWPIAAGALVEDPKHGVLWRLSAGRIEVLAHPAPERLRLEAMRVVRELATSAVLSSPARIQLHAASLEVGGRVLLLAGRKEAGKTTLLCYLAAATGAAVLSNDRVLLADAGDTFVARGVPTIVSIRPGSRRLIPGSFDAVPRAARPVLLTVAEAAAARARVGPAESSVALSLSPAQLAAALGAPLSPGGTLVAIAFPEPDGDAERLRIDRLDPPEAEACLLEARFGIRSGKAGATLFEQFVGSRRAPTADEQLIGRLARSIPCFRVRVAAHSFAEPEAARAVLAACLDV